MSNRDWAVDSVPEPRPNVVAARRNAYNSRRAYATCTKCGSTTRLFVQCQPCLLSFIHATDVASKSGYYEPIHLFQQRSY